jgi:hypothetical protein
VAETPLSPLPPKDPWKSPSYPHRIHAGERPRWQAELKKWDDRVLVARRDLERSSPADPAKQKLFAQMLGARDQIADAVRRLPGEVGDLYEEDHHRLTEAVAALQRLFDRWGAKI